MLPQSCAQPIPALPRPLVYFRKRLVVRWLFHKRLGELAVLRLYPKRIALLFAAVIGLAAGGAREAQAQSGLPLPPGQIVQGTVFKPPFTCSPPNSVPQITNGAEANAFILPPSCTAVPSFVANAPAAMVLTSVPTQYVRVFLPPSVANRPFMVDPGTIRGLTPAQIQDVLALPAVPTMQAIVLVPAGSCVLVGEGAPAFGGRGGPAQEWFAGTPTGANCAGMAPLPLSDYVNQQVLAAQALFYEPLAGRGNPGAVAGALDRGPYPAPFTPMDLMYKSLDLLNFGDPGPLRSALTQLDGEIYASAKTVLLTDSIYVREAVLGRLRQSSFIGRVGPLAALGAGGPTLAYANSSEQDSSAADSALSYADERRSAFPIKALAPAAPPDTVYWIQGMGAWGRLEGDGNAASVNRNLAGGFAGVDRRIGPNWIAGLAAGYTNSFLAIGNPSSSADINTGYLAGYVGASYGPWNLRGALAGSFSFLDASRSIIFPGFADSAGSSYDATTTQVFGEVGYGIAFGAIATEPFVGLAYVDLRTGSFSEAGGSGAAALTGSAGSSDVGYSTLGARAATDWLVAKGMVLTPHASAAWQHAFGPVTPTAALAFETNGAPFTVSGVPLATDAALVQAGFDLHVNPHVTLGLYYFGELAGHVQDNSVQGNLRWRF